MASRFFRALKPVLKHPSPFSLDFPVFPQHRVQAGPQGRLWKSAQWVLGGVTGSLEKNKTHGFTVKLHFFIDRLSILVMYIFINVVALA